MKKNCCKSVSDLWLTYDLAKMVITGIAFGVSLALLDYYNIPSQVLNAIPNKVVWAILGGMAIIVAIWLVANHYFDLFRISATNPVDIVALVAMSTSVTYLFTRGWLIGFGFHTNIALYISGALSLLLLIRIGIRVKQYTEAENKGSNLIDLKDLYDNTISRIPDMPILIRENDVSYDLFDRSEIVNRLYRSIVHCLPDTSYVISLEGEWGSGKTTIINNVKKLMEENAEKHSDIVVIDDFDPWLFGSQEALLLAMYDALIQHVGLRYSPARSNWMVKRIAQVVSENYTAGGIIYNLLHNEAKCSDEVNVLKRRIGTYLLTTNKRVVFFIDNLDRANDENIIFLFKLISLVFDLPGVVYVLSFERERINAILNETREFDQRFTEKIIQQEINVPSISAEKSKTVYSLCICNLLEAYGVRDNELADLTPVLKHIIARIRNVRMFKRIINSVFPAVFGSENCLNKSDLLAVEAIRFFNPGLYTKIYHNQKFFVSHDKTSYDSFMMGFHSKEFNTEGASFLKDLLEQYGESKELLKGMFPYVENYMQNGILEKESHFPDPRAPEITRQSRICSGKYFDLYFSHGTNSFLEIRNKLDQFVKAVNATTSIADGQIVLETALDMLDIEDHKEWVEQLQCHIPEILSSKAYYIAVAMYRMVHKFNDDRQFLGLSAQGRVQYIISELLAVCTSDQFEGFLNDIKTDYQQLMTIWEIYYWLNTSTAQNQAEAKKRAELIRQPFDAICDRILSDKINIYSDENYRKGNAWALYYYCKEKEIIPQFTAYIMKIISPTTLYRVLWDVISLSIGDDYRYYIPEEHMELFFNDKGVLTDLVQKTAPSTDDEKFVRKVYDYYANGVADVWGHKGVITSQTKNLLL